MNRLIKFNKENTFALKVSFFYVGLGTLSVCSVYPDDMFYGGWSLYGVLITFPVSVISFGYRYSEPNLLIPVFIIQSLMFFLTYFLLCLIFKNKKKED